MPHPRCAQGKVQARGAKLNPDTKSGFLKGSLPRVSLSQGVEIAFSAQEIQNCDTSTSDYGITTRDMNCSLEIAELIKPIVDELQGTADLI